MRILVALVFFCALSVPLRAETADVALVLLADGSGSIDEDEFRLQREGYADALTSPEVLSAIHSNVHGRIGVTLIEWAAPESQHVIVDWAIIDGEASAHAFAARLRAEPKITWGYNSISNGIDLSVSRIEAAPFEAMRRVIDVSGDGPNIGGRDIRAARDEAVAKDITINALVIRGPGSSTARAGYGSLEDYYRENVIGGPGAFVEIARGREDFARAVRTKLVLEIARLGIGRRILAEADRGLEPVVPDRDF